MTNYEIQSKTAFAVLGLGTTLTGDYQALPAQKQAFWEKVNADGQLTTLAQRAQNELKFAVNEAINGEMHYYAGVQVAADTPTSGAAMRLIQFPAGNYLVIRGSAATAFELFSQLERV